MPKYTDNMIKTTTPGEPAKGSVSVDNVRRNLLKGTNAKIRKNK